jgi:hypothetical protein
LISAELMTFLSSAEIAPPSPNKAISSYQIWPKAGVLIKQKQTTAKKQIRIARQHELKRGEENCLQVNCLSRPGFDRVDQDQTAKPQGATLTGCTPGY